MSTLIKTKTDKPSSKYLNSSALIFLVIIFLLGGSLILLSGLYDKIKQVSYNLERVKEYSKDSELVTRLIRSYQDNFVAGLAKARDHDLDIVLPGGNVKFADLITQVEYIASSQGVVLKEVAVNEVQELQDTNSVPAPDGEAVMAEATGPEFQSPEVVTDIGANQNNLATADLVINVAGQISSLLNFIRAIETNLRLIDINSFTLSSDDQGEASGETEAGPRSQGFQLSAKVYYLPAKESNIAPVAEEAVPQ